MVDPVSIVQAIISLATAIQRALATMKRNKEDCKVAALRVSKLVTSLKWLHDPSATTPEVSSALESLRLVLGQALQVIEECQDKNSMFNSKDMSKKLSQVDKSISDEIEHVKLVVSLQNHNMLNTQHSQHGVQPLLRQKSVTSNSSPLPGDTRANPRSAAAIPSSSPPSPCRHPSSPPGKPVQFAEKAAPSTGRAAPSSKRRPPVPPSRHVRSEGRGAAAPFHGPTAGQGAAAQSPRQSAGCGAAEVFYVCMIVLCVSLLPSFVMFVLVCLCCLIYLN